MAATQRQAMNAEAPFLSRRYLPVDLFPDILCNLPVKSLLRFRCVSKSWLALVDDSKFALLHLNRFKNNSDETRLFVAQGNLLQIQECVIRCSDTFEVISKIPISLSNGGWDWYVVSSLHGLILLKSLTNTTHQFRDLRVWNPSIRKLLQVPPLRKPSMLLWDKDFGLGYDPVANNYKLVKLIFLDKTLHSVATYALGADSWKTIDFQDKGSSWHWNVYEFYETVYSQGSLYFVSLNVQHTGWELVWFDLSKEVFYSVSMPIDSWWTLVSIDGGSSLVAFDSGSSGLYAWILDRKSMCWTKTHLYTLECSYGFHVKKNGDMISWRFCFDDTMPDEIGEEELAPWNKVTSYSREAEECKILQPRLHYSFFHVFCYVESLFLHK